MLKIHCPERFHEAKAHAKKLGGKAAASLGYCLQRMASYGQTPGRYVTHLGNDFAPLSFSFWVEDTNFPEDDRRRCWFNGGIIFHGSHDGGGDGMGPTFSVSLSQDRSERWEIHT